MSTEENKKIVMGYFEDRAAGSPRAFDRFADSAQWMIMAKGPMGGAKTKAELIKIIEQNTARFEAPVKFTVTGITAEGDRVAVEAQGYAKLKNSGKTYENLYHFLFIVRDGKIQTGKEYCDFLYASDVFRP
jgi:ketosteroid isomerase-like protein